jgi:hypothetical protein
MLKIIDGVRWNTNCECDTNLCRRKSNDEPPRCSVCNKPYSLETSYAKSDCQPG